MGIKHAFTSPKADGADTTLVRPSDWNADHTVTAADVPIVDAAADFTATEVEGALAELQSDNEAHLVAADPHTGYRLESESGVFTIGGLILAPVVDAYIIWRAPFACTVTAIRGYVDVGTTTVINAFKGSVATPTNFSTADMTITSATTWISDTTLDVTSVASGDAVGIEVVTVGTATEITIQVDLTRP